MSKRGKRKLRNKRRRARLEAKRAADAIKAARKAAEAAKSAPPTAAFGHSHMANIRVGLGPEEKVQLEKLKAEREENTKQLRRELFAALASHEREDIILEARRHEITKDIIDTIGNQEAVKTQEEQELSMREGIGIINGVFHQPFFVDSIPNSLEKLPKLKELETIHAQALMEDMLNGK